MSYPRWFLRRFVPRTVHEECLAIHHLTVERLAREVTEERAETEWWRGCAQALSAELWQHDRASATAPAKKKTPHKVMGKGRPRAAGAKKLR